MSSCGFMKDYFPDKKKDYQLTKEIPALKVPTDLSGNNSQPIRRVFPGSTKELDADVKREALKNTVNKSGLYVDLIEYSDKAARIKINDSFIRAWRIVGKALSHQSIEITDRDVINSVYIIQYDPNFEKVEDGSIWDELLFIFTSDPAKEQEYKVKLTEEWGITDVIVLDKNKNELSDGAGLELLKLLYRTIKEDLEE